MSKKTNIIKIAAVIGNQVAHSLSPKIHNYWINKYNLSNSYYIPLSVKNTEDLRSIVYQLPKMGFVGFNITIPYKEEIIPIIEEMGGYIEEDAKSIGAVNTVYLNNNEHYIGINTDWIGFLHSIKNQYPEYDFKGKRVCLLGGGGAARAIVYALSKENVADIAIVNRDKSKMEKIKHDFPLCSINSWQYVNDVILSSDILINSSSLGMINNPELPIDYSCLHPALMIVDIVYNPLNTTLLMHAKNNQHIGGLYMLIEQAKGGFNKWFGVTPENDENLMNLL